jgi:hypothetical protein
MNMKRLVLVLSLLAAATATQAEGLGSLAAIEVQAPQSRQQQWEARMTQIANYMRFRTLDLRLQRLLDDNSEQLLEQVEKKVSDELDLYS